MSAQELHRLLQQGDPLLLLLDVRRPEEVATSTLPGPVLTLAEFELAGGAEAFREREVVAYWCAARRAATCRRVWGGPWGSTVVIQERSVVERAVRRVEAAWQR